MVQLMGITFVFQSLTRGMMMALENQYKSEGDINIYSTSRQSSGLDSKKAVKLIVEQEDKSVENIKVRVMLLARVIKIKNCRLNVCKG